MLSPIILFVYNRPWHTRQTLESLERNLLTEKSTLFIFSDGPLKNASADQLDKIGEVRKVIREKNWCGEVHIIESKTNKGLANSIITGVTDVLNKYPKVIVLEDDILTNKYFLSYCNESLNKYEFEDSVKAISGYAFPKSNKMENAFFLPWIACWGWATWKRSWNLLEMDAKKLLNEIEKQGRIKEFNFNDSYDFYDLLQSQSTGKVDSWAIRWFASIFLKHGLMLFPPGSLTQNIGMDGSGTHYKGNSGGRESGRKVVFPERGSAGLFNFPTAIALDKKSGKLLRKYLKVESSGSTINRIKNHLRKLLKR